MNALPRLGALGLALALAACAGAPAPREQFFTLAAPHPAVAPAASATPSVFVGPVAVPAAVDRSQMVLATGPNEVDVSDAYRWAEPLREGIARVIAETLGRELGTSRVLYSRMAAGGATDYRVAIEVQRFESSLTDGATLDAVWTITGPGVASAAGSNGRAATHSGRTVAHEPAAGADPAALAAAHSRALVRVGHDIAAAISQVRGGS